MLPQLEGWLRPCFLNVLQIYTLIYAEKFNATKMHAYKSGQLACPPSRKVWATSGSDFGSRCLPDSNIFQQLPAAMEKGYLLHLYFEISIFFRARAQNRIKTIFYGRRAQKMVDFLVILLTRIMHSSML